jgi:hypothetical protein
MLRKVPPFPNERLVQLLSKLIMPSGSENTTKEAGDFFREACTDVAAYPKELQAALIPLLENDQDRQHYAFLSNCIEEDLPVTVLKEYVSYHQHLPKGFVSTYLLAALRHYPQLPQLDDYSTATGEARDHISALLTVTKNFREESHRKFSPQAQPLSTQNQEQREPAKSFTLPVKMVPASRTKKDHTKAIVITDDALVQFIVDNHGKATWIADLIIERQTVDTLLLDTIINSTATAVSEGGL